ncbi:MAG: ribonuclease HI, partial [Candidatus Methanomethylicaceae archaeon]
GELQMARRLITVYYDGLCEPRNPKGVATYGFVVYSGEAKIGEGRGLAAEPWSDGASNNVAEYTALIRALEWLIGHGYEGCDLLVRGDSQLSIRQMQGRYSVSAPRIIPLYKRARELVSRFGIRRVVFEWVPREENEEADFLSELALKEYWREYKSEKAAEIRPEEIVHVSGSIFNVRGYKVDAEAETCECPDYVRTNRNRRLRVRLPCKHIVALRDYKIGRPESPPSLGECQSTASAPPSPLSPLSTPHSTPLPSPHLRPHLKTRGDE